MERTYAALRQPEHLEMNDVVFGKLRDLIHRECGIALNDGKKQLLVSRLYKRIDFLGMSGFMQYYRFIESPEGRAGELPLMIDLVTTNKTEFFREPAHFRYLVQNVLPELAGSPGQGDERLLHAWSAGCSTGEEPWSIAMTFAEFFSSAGSGNFSILATDISSRVLALARQAVYEDRLAVGIPADLRRRYCMRGKGDLEGYCRIVPELREKVRFMRHNLAGARWDLRRRMNVVFCRNVIIYFDRATQQTLFENIYRRLVPGGYLFIGNAETLNGLSTGFTYVTPGVYRKPR